MRGTGATTDDAYLYRAVQYPLGSFKFEYIAQECVVRLKN